MHAGQSLEDWSLVAIAGSRPANIDESTARPQGRPKVCLHRADEITEGPGGLNSTTSDRLHTRHISHVRPHFTRFLRLRSAPVPPGVLDELRPAVVHARWGSQSLRGARSRSRRRRRGETRVLRVPQKRGCVEVVRGPFVGPEPVRDRGCGAGSGALERIQSRPLLLGPRQ